MPAPCNLVVITTSSIGCYTATAQGDPQRQSSTIDNSIGGQYAKCVHHLAQSLHGVHSERLIQSISPWKKGGGSPPLLWWVACFGCCDHPAAALSIYLLIIYNAKSKSLIWRFTRSRNRKHRYTTVAVVGLLILAKPTGLLICFCFDECDFKGTKILSCLLASTVLYICRTVSTRHPPSMAVQNHATEEMARRIFIQTQRFFSNLHSYVSLVRW